MISDPVTVVAVFTDVFARSTSSASLISGLGQPDVVDVSCVPMP